MDVISWNNSYSVGVEKIDSQHKKIFELINNLYAAQNSPDVSADIGKSLEDMASYVEYHFETEKSYLDTLPEFKEHEKEHWQFTKKTMQLVKAYKDSPKDKMIVTIVEFLCGWLNNHILETDVQHFQILSSK